MLGAIIKFVKIIHHEHLARCAVTRAMQANSTAMKARLRGAREQVGACKDAMRALTARFEELRAAATLAVAQVPVPSLHMTAAPPSLGADLDSSSSFGAEDSSSPDNNNSALERQFFAVCAERDQLRARLRQALSSVDDMHARDVQSGAHALEQSLRVSRATHDRWERAETARVMAEQQLGRTTHKASKIKKRLLRAQADLEQQLSACGDELERERARSEALTRRCSEGEGEIVLLKESLSLAEQRVDEARSHAEEEERRRLLMEREASITTPPRSTASSREKGGGGGGAQRRQSVFAARYDRADRFMADTKIDLLERKVFRLESEQSSTEELRFQLLAAIEREGGLERLVEARDAQIEGLQRQIARLELDFEEQSRFKEALLMVRGETTKEKEKASMLMATAMVAEKGEQPSGSSHQNNNEAAEAEKMLLLRRVISRGDGAVAVAEYAAAEGIRVVPHQELQEQERLAEQNIVPVT